MCGIVGVVGREEAAPLLVGALKRLEYRGYDSAGVATYSGSLRVEKGAGRIDDIEEELGLSEMDGGVGMGHTRWATHGAPSEENAHPQTDCSGSVAVVHNGIVENFSELRDGLESRGHVFRSETDTEVIPHLVEEALEGSDSLRGAVREALGPVEGSFAVCVLHEGELVAARDGSPLVVGLSDHGNFVASDVPAILPHTRRVKYLMDGELAAVADGEVDIETLGGEAVDREESVVDWDAEDAEKGGYEHFMLKEIHEQPRALRECLSGRLDELVGDVDLGLSFDRDDLTSLDGIEVVACGTSYHAGIYGAELLEETTGIPVSVHRASEYRYGAAVDGDFLTIGVTQSGETADTLGALERARDEGNRLVAMTNVVGSSVSRLAGEVVYIRSGPEVGVAASKTFSNQLVCMAMLAVRFGRETGRLPRSEARGLVAGLRSLPSEVGEVLEGAGAVEEVATRYRDSDAFFFIGRRFDHPAALEGALKMKEISYVHSEGYPAGELKHGPLALVTGDTPVVALLTPSPVYGKTASNAKEVEARGGPVIAVAGEEDGEVERFCTDVLRVPEVDHRLSPVLSTVVLQLLAYRVAVELGRDVDRPRNLAKSVTVE